ncbi:hypothetical protein BGZ83_002260 [Gryganskiella cystojenkinii]|nr:hypothetical protein BGZ83_002260 [Gryganskiella cystojenkinii]
MQQQQLQQQQLMHQQEQLRLHQFHQEHQRQQQLATASVANSSNNSISIPRSQSLPLQQQLQPQQQQQPYVNIPNTNNNSNNNSNYPTPSNTSFTPSVSPPEQQASWSDNTTILQSQQQSQQSSQAPLALALGQDGSLLSMAPRWDSYDLDSLPVNVIMSNNNNNSNTRVPSRSMDSNMPRVPVFNNQPHPSMQRQYLVQSQGPQESNIHDILPQQQQLYPQHIHMQQQSTIPQDLFTNDYLFDAPSPVPTMSSLDLGLPPNQQLHASPSPIHIPEYSQLSCSPDMPIKNSPVDSQPSWAPWGDNVAHPATPAHSHNSFDDDAKDNTGIKELTVFTSSKKDDDGEFRKGQQFYLNVQLKDEDRERYRYLRIPAENIVLPCKSDSTGRISLNASGKRSADTMSIPTSAQEEDVLSLKLTTYLEPEHRAVVPCGRCKDKTPEILRFHPGVNGKPMIDENGMVTLRSGQIKLIASAWCASTSHHRGPGTKFSFEIELTSMSYHAEPVLVYRGSSDKVEIYASHGRDKGSRSNMNPAVNPPTAAAIAMAKQAAAGAAGGKSQSPPLQDSSAGGGPPSPAKTSSPPGSPATYNAAHNFDTGPVKKRREETPMTPPLHENDMPMIKSLEPRSGPICQENHVIIIGENFVRGMTPMFGREYGKVIDIKPYYIECTTPRYPKTETVRLWIHHNEGFLPSDKTYDFTNELAQSELEQMLRNMIQSDGDFMGNGFVGDSGSYFNLLGRITGLPPSTDISGQSQSNGSTMLHNSVLLGYQAGVDLLIEEGIELDIEDDSGLTALDYAIHTNNVEITTALLYAGSIISYERLDMLPLRPTPAMRTLLKEVCDVDLAVDITIDQQAEVPDADHAEERSSMDVNNGNNSDEVPINETLVQQTIVEVLEPEDQSSEPESHMDPHTSMRADEEPVVSVAIVPSSPPSAQRIQQHPLQQQQQPIKHHSDFMSKASRAMSFMSSSSRSTGMGSLAPSMSTLAPSATSSMQSRNSSMSSRSVNQGGKGGVENIYLCAKKGSLSMVKHHLEKDPTLINAPWKFDGRSVLSSACASAQPQELVEFLVQRGALPNSVDSFYKRTALHTLCEEGGISQDDWRIVMSQQEIETNERDCLAAMRFLLDHGATVDAKNAWKETPLMKLLAGRDCPLMVQELYSRGTDSRLKSSKDVYPHGTALSYAAFFGRIKSLKWMIENDLLLNDEASIKDAIKWAKLFKGEQAPHGAQGAVVQSVKDVRKREERKAEVLRLLEGWLGEQGQTKRKVLAKDVVSEHADGWWSRMSGIVVENPQKHVEESSSSSSSAQPATSDTSILKMPEEMRPLWRDVQILSENLANPELVTSPGKNKWNPLTKLRKGT